MANLGEILKTAREEQGLTLAEVESATHIRQHLLQAMETDNFKQFPSPIVARGLIRNYAKFLKLDPLEALTLYDGNGLVPIRGQRLTSDGIEFMNLTMAPRPLLNWELVIGAFLFLLVVGGAGYLAYGALIAPGITPTPTKTPDPQALDEDAALLLPTVTPLPTDTPTPPLPTDTPTPIVYGGVTVELAISQPSWIQILADDAKVFEGVLQPGERQSWTGQRRVAIRAGNAGGVEVIVNGLSRGVMGAEGQVVDQIWEKVDNPATLTPQPGETAAPPGTETPTPEEEGLLPLESAPQGEGQ